MMPNPFGQFKDWKKQWDYFFNQDFWQSFEPFLQTGQRQESPGVNIYSRENELLVVVSIPGLQDIEQVEVYAEYNVLEVRAEISLPFGDYELIEEGIFQGTMEKTISLPFAIKEDRIDATYRHGLLLIHLHRLIPNEIKRKVQIKKLDT